MKCQYLYFLIVLISLQLGYSQQLELRFQLIDEATESPISDAHIFINGSSMGTVSDAEGICELNVSPQETQELIITHIAYETLVLLPEQYRALLENAPIRMKGNGVNLSEIEFTAKRSSKWKKNLRKFRKALLGDGIAASKCKILNPEVLRFEEQNGKFSVRAIDLLHIDNDYLGYDIQFLLEELSIESDGSTIYKGNVQFTDKADVNEARKKRRSQIYQNSLAHFLSSLISSPNKAALEQQGYLVAMERYSQGQFTNTASPEPQELVQADSKPGFYQLHFSEFLSIKHKSIKLNVAGQRVNVSNAEQQKYGSNASVSIGEEETLATSRLYKIKPYLLVDIRGNIINKAAVKEYGYWADRRLATTLPIDYKKFSDFNLPSPSTESAVDTLLVFKHLLGGNPEKAEAAVQFLQNNWSDTYIAPLLDILRLGNDWQQREIGALLKARVPEMEAEYFAGIQYLWKNKPSYDSYYANFKAHLYSAIDTAFHQYFFERETQSNIRLDEIVWGGVKQDGIPPLRAPNMIKAEQALYLSDSDVVFGLVIDGMPYAYPKRILAWHEFFTDDIEGLSIAGVYCTLCGTLIIYNTEFDGVKHDLGTSGFLYRSNKLMYDSATQSLWSTIMGEPVVGPLVHQNIELSTLPVETTTWGEWRSRHPNTKVLSLNTGHDRNYDEGAAYKDYYSNDALMFPVPNRDARLLNKARVFIPRTEQYTEDPLAVAVAYLKRKGIHQDKIGTQPILIITAPNGASRAYVIDQQQFKSYKKGILLDTNKKQWQVTETALIGPDGQQLARLPAHEVFWFAWVTIFPGTRVVY